MQSMTVNIRQHLTDLSTPLVMGILNVTPDSFYSGSRAMTEEAVLRQASQLIADGADIIDVGACSTRPGSTPATADEEMRRLDMALPVLRRQWPDIPLSIDTFRADVARRCVEQLGADIINDIGGGEMDKAMFGTVAELKVPYVLTHSADLTSSSTPVEDVCLWLAQRLDELHLLGVADVLVDPGFGFGKTLEQNFELMSRLSCLQALQAPLLVGISRKSMIWRTLDCAPEQSLNGTTVLNTIALQAGANILRVHDVRAARETISLYNACFSHSA
ncbi:MAG: dihydropteroate synthase [Bacteroidaceae bacterium]|nr:dihydropteroate synthase [Bacteroidaceae bacterium]